MKRRRSGNMELLRLEEELQDQVTEELERLRYGHRRRHGAQQDGIPRDDQVFMLPWFLPKDIYIEIRRLLPNIHIEKMRFYFDDYGCLRCERRDVLYRSNGLCEQCNAIIRHRLTQSLKRRLKTVGEVRSDSPAEALGRGMKHARMLLRSPVAPRARIH